MMRDTLCAKLLIFSLMGDLMNGDLLNFRKDALSFGFKRRSLNSADCEMIWS
jgi:hypothetical protein